MTARTIAAALCLALAGCAGNPTSDPGAGPAPYNRVAPLQAEGASSELAPQGAVNGVSTAAARHQPTRS